MIKILYVVSSLKRTGPINILFDLVKYLDRSRFIPHILTLRSEPPNSRYHEFVELNVEIDSLHHDGKVLTPGAVNEFKKIVTQIRPHVVHSMGFRPDVLSGFFLADQVRISSQLNYPFDDYPMTYGKVIGGIMARLTAKTIKRMNIAVACAQDVSDKLRKRNLSLPVICNSIDLALFNTPTEVEITAARKRFKIPDNAGPVFIFVGVLADRKQPLVAIEAFNKIHATIKNSYLIVLGDGNLREECEKTAAPYAEHFRFMGNVSDTRPYLTAADYYIATSKAEGMPVSVLEALALKLPVVLSDINPHKEILAFNRHAGELARTGSVEDTARAMMHVLSRDRPSMAQAGRSIVEQHLNSQLMSTDYQRLYTEFVK